MAEAYASDYDLQREQLRRRRAIAEAQLAASMQPMGGTEMVSGRAVRQSPLSPIAKIAQAYFANKGIEGANQEEKQIGQSARDQVAQALSEYQTAVTPRAAAPGGVDESGFDVHPAVPAYNPSQEDRRAAALRLMGSAGGDPRDIAKLVVAEAMKPREFKAYKPGDVLFQDGKQVGAIPEKPEGKPSAVREYEYAVSQGFKGTFDEFQREQRRAGATNVTVSTEKKYGEQFAGAVAKQDVDMRDAAMKAPDLAERANRVKETLATGRVITGAGADYRLAFGKALGLAGASDQETLVNTETLVTDLASNTLDAIKASGLGSGTGFSNADRDFLEKAKGGKITLEAGTIDRLATLAHRAAEKSAERWGQRMKDIPADALQGAGIRRETITVPPLFGGKSKARISPETQRYLDQYAPEGQ